MTPAMIVSPHQIGKFMKIHTHKLIPKNLPVISEDQILACSFARVATASVLVFVKKNCSKVHSSCVKILLVKRELQIKHSSTFFK